MLIASVVVELVEFLILELSHRGKTELDGRPGWVKRSFQPNQDYLESRESKSYGTLYSASRHEFANGLEATE